MAVPDKFAGVSVKLTAAATTVDLQGYNSQAILLVGTGATSAVLLTESDSASSGFTTIADADLLFSTKTGQNVQGTPADGKIVSGEIGVVRYRGVKRYLRCSGVNITAYISLGMANQVINTGNDIAD